MGIMSMSRLLNLALFEVLLASTQRTGGQSVFTKPSIDRAKRDRRNRIARRSRRRNRRS